MHSVYALETSMKLFLAKEFETNLAQLSQELPHAVLLVGPEGIGLLSIATKLAGSHLSGVISPTDPKGNIDPSSSGVIRIAQMRDLSSHAINKTNSERIYIIDNADQMNHQAQNSFLKLLEEPVPHVHFVLVSHHSERLLPTVLSRVQALRVPPISHDQSVELLDTLRVMDETKRTRLLFLADGLPATLTRLVGDKEVFQAKITAITDARLLLQGTAIDKFRITNTYGGNRAGTLELLSYAERILRHSLAQHPSTQLIERADDISEAYDRIAANGHIRIQLLRLVV